MNRIDTKNDLKKVGITLIETVLYLALLSVIFAVSMPLLIEQHLWQSKQNSFADTAREYLFVYGKIQNIVHEERFDELAVFDPTQLLATSTRVTSFLVLPVQRDGFETVDFSLSLNGKNFGTTTLFGNF